MSWRTEAACADQPTSLFFAGERASNTYYNEAKEFCKRCEVRTECLAYALLNGIENGLWGGLTPIERRREAA